MSPKMRTAVFLIFLLAGGEAARLSMVSKHAVAHEAIQRETAATKYQFNHLQSSATKIPDLDWPGCGKKSGTFARKCKKLEGCAIQKVWLDTPKQSCRYTDQYKLQPDFVARFLEVELARLEDKSQNFAKSGCIFGGWWTKCYRRLNQIIRLLRYVRRAVADAKADPQHPAHSMASSEEVQNKLERVAQNIAKGFEKHEAGKQFPVLFGKALAQLKGNPEILKAAEDAAASKNVSLSAEEKESLQKAASVEAMLAVTGTELTATQREELLATVEAEGTIDSSIQSEDDIDKAVDNVVRKLDENMNKAAKSDLENAREQESNESYDPDGASLVELQGAHNRSLASRGTGPLKWLFKNGLGWVVTRMAWLLLFLVASAIGIIAGPARIAVFVLSFLLCTLSKFIVWVFKDFAYGLVWKFLWEGPEGVDGELIQGRFKAIGKCAPQTWNLVGFEPDPEKAKWMAGGGAVGAGVGAGAAGAGAITGATTGALAGPPGIVVGAGVGAAVGAAVGGGVFIDAGHFASKVTGVHHLWKGAEDLCKYVRCGTAASCFAGKCHCDAGAYPIEGTPNCGALRTNNGCECLARWREDKMLGLWSKAHYGCSPDGYCQVDARPNSASYSACKDKLSGDTDLKKLLKVFGITRDGPAKDKCKAKPFRMIVPSLSQETADTCPRSVFSGYCNTKQILNCYDPVGGKVPQCDVSEAYLCPDGMRKCRKAA